MGLVIFSFGDTFPFVNATEGWLTENYSTPLFEAGNAILEFNG
jgi:hypothetical protein